jgi:hypothetical protein
MPSYQVSAPAALNLIEPAAQPLCHVTGGYCREVPDVSADADPASGYLIYYNGGNTIKRYPSGWQGTGGTSGSSPVWAAVIALADAEPACAGAPVGFANPALYAAAAQGQSTYFDDVTSGNNDLLNKSGTLFSAGPGYDMASGLGTPNAGALAPELCKMSLRVFSPGSERTVLNAITGVQIHTAGATGALQFTAKGLPEGLTISPSGLISGTTTRDGVFTVEVSASEGGASVDGVEFTWTVQGKPAISSASLRRVSGGKPVLSVTVAAGKDAPALRTIVLRLPGDLRLARRLTHVSVSSGASRSLAHRISGQGEKLTVTLRTAASPVTLVLGAGSVIPAGALVTSVRLGHRSTVGLGVEAIDDAGLRTALAFAVRPLR